MTGSFTIDVPSVMFEKLFRHCCDNHEIQYPYSEDEEACVKFEMYIQDLWKDFGDDICAYLDGATTSAMDDIEWDDDVEVTKAVLVDYIDFCRENTDICIEVETFWKERMLQAMEAHAEALFDTNGPCDIYGEPLKN